ncbi:MFS transporter [Occallatibacter savannae]|uniref:MFS transporter n=1 Tax=Occallatibacter savannae TaxID=1002691 RepID=UPI000D695029|nr:MFS transporter [Occallatibacter savannae]
MRRLPPLWVMGLANGTLGFASGIMNFVMPQLMASVHVPEPKIALITAIAVSPNFWCFMFGPMLDVRFSRRWYATVLAIVSGAAATIAMLSLHHLLVLQAAMVMCNASAALSAAALGGWLSNIVPDVQKNSLSKWINIALVCGTGLIVGLSGELVRGLGIVPAAVALGLLIVLPTCTFVLIPAPGPDRRLAGESFAQFNREVLALLRRREVLIVLLLFLSPCSSFVMPNLMGGLGADFHASARAVSFWGGVGAFIPGLLGCFLFPVIARRLKLRFFYLANGILGCLFTLSLVAMPHTTATFAGALFGEYMFQAVAFSIQIGIVFEAIGPDNPLAATTFSFLTAATNVPVTYVTAIDGRAYARAGITGTLFMDAAIGIVTCLVAGVVLAQLERGRGQSGSGKMELVEAVREEV